MYVLIVVVAVVLGWQCRPGAAEDPGLYYCLSPLGLTAYLVTYPAAALVVPVFETVSSPQELFGSGWWASVALNTVLAFLLGHLLDWLARKAKGRS